MRYKIEITGLEKLQEVLTNLQHIEEQTAPLMRRISNEMMNASDRAFAKEKDPETGIPWKAWSPSYLESLTRSLGGKSKKRGKGKQKPLTFHKKLNKTGQLKGARTLIQEPGVGGVGILWPYARIHQLGGEIHLRNHTIKIPARPYLGMDEYAENKITYFVHDWFDKLIKKA